MPQDTINYSSTNDSSAEATRYIPQKNIIEQDLKEKSKAGSEWAPLYVIGMLALVWIIIRIRDGKSKGYVALGSIVNNETDTDIIEGDGEAETETVDYLSYEGTDLHFSEEEIIKMLNRRCAFYKSLADADKEKFILRLQRFMKQKTFKIHDKSGFKEMPVLISAAAIQLSFGLEKYMLPDFPFIHIFPEEFIGMHPSIRFLEGNVSGNCINISWKHFLQGFEYPTDGQNVGLHEMAHAYYYQNFETGNNERNFVSTFSKFNNSGNKVFEQEQKPGYDLYSDYAMRNFQEFWAESVEIFFEKPVQMKNTYPELYAVMSDLLNQDPVGNGESAMGE